MPTQEGVSYLAKFYEYEEQRRRDIDQKASWGLGFSGIVVGLSSSMLNLFLGTPIVPVGGAWWLLFGPYLAGLLSTLVAVYVFWGILRFRAYVEPLEDEEDLMEELGGADVSYDELYYSYTDSLLRNRIINDRKTDRYGWGFAALGLGISLICLSVALFVLCKYV
jgi:hypothetical protein